MRASIVVLGPLLARTGRAQVALPGGDEIGSRPIDLHLQGLTKLGARIRTEHGFVIAEAPSGLRGAVITLDYPSVGATENLMMAAVAARGLTVIDNAAREPEIADTAVLLRRWARGSTGRDEHDPGRGRRRVHPAEHTTIPDRIEAGTWAPPPRSPRAATSSPGCSADHLDLLLPSSPTPERRWS